MRPGALSDASGKSPHRNEAQAGRLRDEWAFQARGISVFSIAASVYNLAIGSAGRRPAAAWWKKHMRGGHPWALSTDFQHLLYSSPYYSMPYLLRREPTSYRSTGSA